MRSWIKTLPTLPKPLTTRPSNPESVIRSFRALTNWGDAPDPFLPEDSALHTPRYLRSMVCHTVRTDENLFLVSY